MAFCSLSEADSISSGLDIGPRASPLFLAIGIHRIHLCTYQVLLNLSNQGGLNLFCKNMRSCKFRKKDTLVRSCECTCDSLRIPLYAKSKHPSSLFFLRKRHLHGMQVRSRWYFCQKMRKALNSYSYSPASQTVGQPLPGLLGGALHGEMDGNGDKQGSHVSESTISTTCQAPCPFQKNLVVQVADLDP